MALRHCAASAADDRLRRAIRPAARLRKRSPFWRPLPAACGDTIVHGGNRAQPAPRGLILGHRSQPGVPRSACRRLLASVQHRVPGSVPGRHELPRLPESGRRRPIRGGLHPVARAESGRGDVRLRVLGPVRARLPPRRHRPAAGDPGHEALPRRVAPGVRHPRRHASDHAARHDRRGHRRRPCRRRGGARAGCCRPPGHGLRRAALRRRHDAHRRAGVPPAARGDRDGPQAGRAAGRPLPVRHASRP